MSICPKLKRAPPPPFGRATVDTIVKFLLFRENYVFARLACIFLNIDIFEIGFVMFLQINEVL